MSNVNGTANSETLDGTSSDDTINFSQGGTDLVRGFAGDDTLIGGAAFDASDTVKGGAGEDTLDLLGNYSAGVTFGATTVLGVEKIHVGSGFSYNLTTHDNTIAAGGLLVIDGYNMSAGQTLVIDGSAETDGSFLFYDGVSNDVFTGGAQWDNFSLAYGGNDIAHGGGGDDTINMDAALTAADQLDGGAGNDTVYLRGDYDTPLTLGANTFTSIETLALLSDHTYNLTTVDENVAAGENLFIDGRSLGGAGHMVFNGSAETDGTFSFIDGAANDLISGSQNGDIFNSSGGVDIYVGNGGDDQFIMNGNLDGSDWIFGGTGEDRMSLHGDYSAGLTLGSLVNGIERIELGGGFDYNLTTRDANVGAGSDLLVSAEGLGVGNHFTFDGSAELDGTFNIYGGNGADTITGGHGNDTIGGSGGSDTLNGGVGNDHLSGDGGNDNLNGDEGDDSLFGGLGDDKLKGGDGNDNLYGGSGNNKMVGGNGNDYFAGYQDGTDIAHGGEGDDYIDFGAGLTNADFFDGGNGTDHVYLSGTGYDLTLDASSLANIEGITFAGSFDFHMVAQDSLVGAGNTLAVDSYYVPAGNSFFFDGSAETDGSFNVIGGLGNDTLIGGAGNDTLTGRDGNDVLKGGGGTNTLDGGAGSDTADFSDMTYEVRAIAAVVVPINVTVGGVLKGTTTSVENLTGGSGDDWFLGSFLANKLLGNAGNDHLIGFGGNDTLKGGEGDDIINGGNGKDVLNGGGGADHLTGGGGNDVFVYTALTDSSGPAVDHIFGFASGDKLDVHAIDAVAGGADNVFTLDAGNGFTAGEIHQTVVGSGVLVEFITDPDPAAEAEMSILLVGRTTAVGLGDFVL